MGILQMVPVCPAHLTLCTHVATTSWPVSQASVGRRLTTEFCPVLQQPLAPRQITLPLISQVSITLPLISQVFMSLWLTVFVLLTNFTFSPVTTISYCVFLRLLHVHRGQCREGGGISLAFLSCSDSQRSSVPPALLLHERQRCHSPAGPQVGPH